jgi:hypothetical protein
MVTLLDPLDLASAVDRKTNIFNPQASPP